MNILIFINKKMPYRVFNQSLNLMPGSIQGLISNVVNTKPWSEG